MAKGKKISEVSVADSLQGDELIPFAKNGANGSVTADTIKEFVGSGSHLTQDDLDNALEDYVAKEDGKGLSSNDFSDTDKSKLDGIEAGAQVNTVDSVNGRTGAVTGLAEASDIPTKVSELENDADYQTESDVDAKIAEVTPTALDVYTKTEADGKFVAKVTGKDLSSNDYTTDEKNKLSALPTATELDASLDAKADKSTTYTKTEVDTELANKADKTSIPTKVSQLTNDSKYQTETQVNTALANKVDKVSGKQLSTEDFTTLLKSKLEQLAIDVPDLDERLETLKTTLDTLIGTDDATAAIDRFYEIENFLAGITNTQTLTGLLKDLKDDIVALCADTYLPISGGIVTGEVTISNNDLTKLFHVHRTSNSPALVRYSNSDKFLGFIGVSINREPIFYKGKDDGTYESAKKLLYEGNYADIIYTGTSSQFLKADGSVDSTAYLPKSGGTVNSLDIYRTAGEIPYIDFSKNTNGEKTVAGEIGFNPTTKTPVYYNFGTNTWDEIWCKGNDGSGSGLDADLLDGIEATGFYRVSQASAVPNSDIDDIRINGTYRLGTTLTNLPTGVSAGDILSHYDWDVNAAIQIIYKYNADKAYYRRKSVGVWKDWVEFAFTTSNVASADKLTTKQLTNEDLNDIKDYGVIYYAGSGNTCKNKPTGYDSFNLTCYLASSSLIQVLIDAIGTFYKRAWAGSSWTSWQQLATTDGAVAKLTTKQLTNEDLNNIKDVNFSSYYAGSNNTCANKPEKVIGYFNLHVYYTGGGDVTQFIITFEGNTYRRSCVNNTWSPWKKMLTEDDVTKVQQVSALPASPNANTLYVIPE